MLFQRNRPMTNTGDCVETKKSHDCSSLNTKNTEIESARERESKNKKRDREDFMKKTEEERETKRENNRKTDRNREKERGIEWKSKGGQTLKRPPDQGLSPFSSPSLLKGGEQILVQLKL